MEEPFVVYSDMTIQAQRISTAPGSLPQLHINFQLSCDPYYFDWITSLDPTAESEPQLLSEYNTPRLETHISFNDREQFRRHVRQIMARELQHWPLSCICRQHLIRCAIREANRAAMDRPPDHSLVHVYIHVSAVIQRVFYQGPVAYIDDNQILMVPAEDSAIESLLETVIIVDSCDEDCTICLEEIGVKKAVRMPCSHVFHGDCIKKWLRTSCYCPLCRFEMPTLSSSSSMGRGITN